MLDFYIEDLDTAEKLAKLINEQGYVDGDEGSRLT